MRKTFATIVLALGLVFAVAPLAATAAPSTVPCSTTGGGNTTPCDPACVPTVDFLNAIIAQLDGTVADKDRVIGIVNAREDAYVAKIARKNHRIHVLERKLARAQANG